MVIRVDLGYRDGAYSRGALPSTVTLERAQNDLSRLHNNMRGNLIFDHLEGRISKLEYGASKGYHFHTFFFFNGDERQNSVHLAREIGEYWEKTITKGDGLAHNCNRSWANRPRGSGVGMVYYDNSHKRARLLIALAYITKSDQHLQVRIPEVMSDGKVTKPKDHCFIKGQVKPSKSNAGRPRRPRILGGMYHGVPQPPQIIEIDESDLY